MDINIKTKKAKSPDINTPDKIENINANRHQYRNMIEMNKHLIAICMANLEEISSRTERRYDEYQGYNMKRGGERYARDLKEKQQPVSKLKAWRNNFGKPAIYSFFEVNQITIAAIDGCLLYTSPSPRD